MLKIIFTLLITGLVNSCTLDDFQSIQLNAVNENTTSSENSSVGKQSFLFTEWAGPALKVWTFTPTKVNANTPVLVVMHGNKRDADRYRDEWAGIAEQHNLLLIVPQFTRADFPRANGYNLGNVFKQGTDYQEFNSKHLWSYSAIEPLFDVVKKRFNSKVDSYVLYGHSAGSQFVHRFLYFVPDARVNMAVTANAGWYTLPDFDADFPYGTKNTPIQPSDIVLALAKPLYILLGETDNDPNHKSLRKAPEAMLQGPHRFARGNFYFDYAKKLAERDDLVFNWHLQTVPNVGHSNRLMANAAIDLMLAKKVLRLPTVEY